MLDDNTKKLSKELTINLTNREWRLNNLYFIKDAQGKRVLFRMNWAQKYLFDNLWYLNVILKARQLGVCLDPKTRVLTADLEWKYIKDLEVGTELISVDENSKGRGKGRKMRIGVVQGVVSVFREAYKITFDDGRSVVCTGQHPWLSRKVNTDYAWRNIDGVGRGNKKAKITVGTKIRSITKPWDNSQSYEDGWIGGIIDGEGSFSNANRKGAQVGIAQVDGDVLKRVKKYFKDRKYNYRIEADRRKAGTSSKFGNKIVYKIIVGRINELFRLCGKSRPSRFIKNRWWEDREMPINESCATVVKIEKLGKKKMIDLQTSVGTYIAEGFVSHNTTFFCILYLDDVLFNGLDAGLIAHTLSDASKIFDTKIRYAWDNMIPQIKNQYRVDSDSTKQLKFTLGNNQSSIYVGTSLRSGTVQRLHISELATIDQKDPLKSVEIKSGALNTVHKGQVTTIESTSKGAVGVFYDMANNAMDLKKANKTLTGMDYKFFFFPWWKHPEYELDTPVTITRATLDYFEKLRIRYNIELSRPKQNWYYKKKIEQKEAMMSEFPSTPEESFLAHIEGSYYGKQIDKVMEQGRITKVPYDEKLPVDTWWDIGTSTARKDSTSITFTQSYGLEIRVIDFYGNSGEGLPHYKKILEQKDYVYGNHYAPHDITVKEWGTGKTRFEVAGKIGVHFIALPKLGLLDGIEAVRSILSRCWFDEVRTAELIKALKAYRKEWDEKMGNWKPTPLKDWSVDPADSFRMLAIGYHKEHINPIEKKEDYKQDNEEGFDKFYQFPELG